MSDLPEGINPGIRKTVALLNGAGFKTCDSGDGETHDFECDRDEGYVVVVLDEDDDIAQKTREVGDLLVAHGVDVNATMESVIVQGTYGYADQLKTIDVHGIHDRMLR